MEIAPGIHRIETEVGGRVACVFLLRGENGAVLVDTGMNYAPDENILPYLAEIGCPPEDVRQVIITHCDFDHMGGGVALRAALPNAQFLCHPAERIESQDVEMLIAHRMGEFGRDHGMPDSDETLAWVRDNVSPTGIDGVLAGGEQIDLGGLTADILVLPGHSAGHLALYVPDRKVAIVADAVLGASLLFRDGSPAFPPTYRYPGQYAQTIDALERLPIDLMLTSHFDPMDKAATAAFLVETRDFMDRLDKAVAREFATGSATTVRALSEKLAPEFGNWTAEAGMLMSWPVLGHLERMVASGAVTCERRDAVCTYQRADAPG
ncbi:MAG: MBL fold metallo-hydrolase [Hyphomicrobiales bacterium]|nr:MBL fold metallo-hydrolase [Hyphomicrobiales bacterium]